VVLFLAEHIRALTESFDPKLADARNHLFRQNVRQLCRTRATDVTRGLPRCTDTRQASRLSLKVGRVGAAASSNNSAAQIFVSLAFIQL
jgi:hypothetical protein